MFEIKNDYILKQGQKEKNQTDRSWELSRRNFVKFVLLSGIISQVPWATSCVNQADNGSWVTIVDLDFSINLKTIQNVQEILFPSDNLGPGANEVKAEIYLLLVLHDKRLDQSDSQQIANGFKKLEQLSDDQHQQSFWQLKSTAQKELIERIAVMDWGQRFLSKLLTLILESLYANENYGSNPEGIGWRWLHHQPGWPQPTADQIYPTLLEQNQLKFKS